MTTSVAAAARTRSRPLASSGTNAMLAIVVWPADQFNVDVPGHGTPFLKSETQPGVVLLATVQLTNAAVAPVGTAPRCVMSRVRSPAASGWTGPFTTSFGALPGRES